MRAPTRVDPHAIIQTNLHKREKKSQTRIKSNLLANQLRHCRINVKRVQKNVT